MKSANLSIHAWALIQNFAPLNPWTIKQKGYVSSFERVNEFKYHENWLHNLLISGSLGGLQTGPPKSIIISIIQLSFQKFKSIIISIIQLSFQKFKSFISRC